MGGPVAVVPRADVAARSRSTLGVIIALITLGSGLLNVYSVIGPSLPERHAILRTVFPLEFVHLSRFATLLLGFTLVILSINIYRRKKRAIVAAMVLSVLSVVFHLTKGLDYEEALFSLLLLLALVVTRREFTVRSGVPNFAGCHPEVEHCDGANAWLWSSGFLAPGHEAVWHRVFTHSVPNEHRIAVDPLAAAISGTAYRLWALVSRVSSHSRSS
jgi:lysylphosphatidylglycerol synthetase-like protein (DUF2156 family)